MKKLAATPLFAALFLFLAASAFAAPAVETVEIGQPFIIEFSLPKAVADVRLSWLGKEVPLSPRSVSEGGASYSALLGTDMKTTKAGTREVAVNWTGENGEGAGMAMNINLLSRKYPSEKLKIAPKQLTPPKEAMPRIEREAKLGRAALRVNTSGAAPLLPLTRPVPGGLTSVYGKSRYFNGVFKGRHGGLDMRARHGTQVLAAADGTVAQTGNFWFAGNCVYIDHGAGVVSFYCHMSKRLVRDGQSVKAGDVIGLSGATGRVTGPHLHFSTSWLGEFFDPAPLLDGTPKKILIQPDI